MSGGDGRTQRSCMHPVKDREGAAGYAWQFDVHSTLVKVLIKVLQHSIENVRVAGQKRVENRAMLLQHRDGHALSIF